MVYAFPGAGALDYFPCHYGSSRLLFRGPHRSTTGPYVACLGGTETYGKFVPRPFPDLTEGILGLPVVNLGCVNGGPDLYLAEDGVLALAARAQVAVVQISGAQNLSNRFYSVHPRRNDRFLGATALLRNLYREVDFTEFNFTRHLLSHLQRLSPSRFQTVVEELRASWLARMRQLVARLDCPVVLLWLADGPPPAEGARPDLRREPPLIDQGLIAALRPHVSEVVEVPATAEIRAAGAEGMAHGPLEGPAAAGLPGPLHHRAAAEALVPAIERLM